MGWPQRPSRKSFGPTMDITVLPVNVTQQVGGPQFNLDWWQVSGTGLVAAAAMVGIGSDGTRLAAAEAWNPTQVGSNPPAVGAYHPTVTRTSAGVYVVTYGYVNAPDETGTLQSLNLQWAAVLVQSTTAGAAGRGTIGVSGSTYVANIACDVAGTPTDMKLLALFW